MDSRAIKLNLEVMKSVSLGESGREWARVGESGRFNFSMAILMMADWKFEIALYESI